MQVISTKNKLQVERRGRLSVMRVVTLMTLAILSPGSRAQVTRFAPVKKGSASSISVRDLAIPGKALDEYNRGVKKLDKRDPKGSLRHFKTALQMYPDYYEAQYGEGVAQLHLNSDDKAQEAFQKAIDMSGGRYARAQFGYALVLSRKGRAAEAERVARSGLVTEPNVSEGHLVLGLALLKLHRTDDAVKSAREALALNDSNSPKAFLILSDAEAVKGNYDAQIRYLDTYLKLRPHDPNKMMLQSAREVAKRLAARSGPGSKPGDTIAADAKKISEGDSCTAPCQPQHPF
jgi:tetratricopeptide (TPR) repeat protein